ncbi:MAG: hypothetical protein KAW89_06240 [Armatimonadetes bacterium]|nr:hypothetical protein [Armatimonadota bacterium]
MQLRLHVIVLATLALLVAASPTFPQAEFVASYATPHLFALPTATTTRLFGMGGFVTCIRDVGFANPAFAGTLQTSQSLARYSATDFDGGLKMKGMQVSYAQPLRPGQSGWQVTYFDLDSDQGWVSAGGATALATYEEQDLAVHYGQRVGERWVLGLGLSPLFDTEANYFVPGPMLSERLKSDVDFGFRLGGLYQIDELSQLGFIYDSYKEDVSWSGTMLSPGSAGFDSEEIAIGISRQVSEQVLAAIEWQQLTTEGVGVKMGDSGFRFGAEVALTETWTARAGWNDGALSLGAGWIGDGWSAQYAFIDDWNDDMVGASLGGSDTHQFEVRRQW